MNSMTLAMHGSLHQHPIDVQPVYHPLEKERDVVEQVCQSLGIRYDHCNQNELVLTTKLDEHSNNSFGEQIRIETRLRVASKIIDVQKKYTLGA
ncbi:MAG: hypothetical protein ACW98K_13860 [Candidatus Kariarchaeaceae archaeon]